MSTAVPARSSRCGSGIAGPDPPTGDVAAPNPAVGLGAELALELHEAPHLGPVENQWNKAAKGRSLSLLLPGVDVGHLLVASASVPHRCVS